MVTLVRESKYNLFYRENNKIDKITLNFGSAGYCRGPGEYYRIIKFCKDCIVMDIGANIGYFTYFALLNGAKKVYAYEPEPENINIYEQQGFDKEKVKLYQAAVGGYNGTAFLKLKQPDSHSIFGEKTNSLFDCAPLNTIKVNILSFKDEIERIKPDFIKCDIEGAEYYIDWSNIPNYVKYIAIEIHYNIDQQKGDELLQQLKSQFEIIKLRVTKFVGVPYTTVFMGKR